MTTRAVGVSVIPLTHELDEIRALLRIADEGGLDLVAIQDHPPAALLRHVVADPGSLPLRPPAVLARTPRATHQSVWSTACGSCRAAGTVGRASSKTPGTPRSPPAGPTIRKRSKGPRRTRKSSQERSGREMEGVGATAYRQPYGVMTRRAMSSPAMVKSCLSSTVLPGKLPVRRAVTT